MTDLLLDVWAPLNRYLTESTFGRYPGQWIPTEHERRLHAYTILSAAESNNLVEVLPVDETGEKPPLSEWGEAALVVSRITAGLLSRSLTFTVEGAEQPPPDMPNIPDRIPAPAGDDPSEQAAYTAAVEVRETRAQEAIAAWRKAHDDYRTAKAWQAWWDDWARTEQYAMKLRNMERDYVSPLGDGVLVHQWNAKDNRPTVYVIDPAEYFPVLDVDGGRWPETVHQAYETKRRNETDGTLDERLHKITWRTVELDEPRSLPWNEAPTTVSVELTERWWPKADAGTWGNLDPTKAETVRDGDDLGIDFVPIVHVPNTGETVQHFGQSSLAEHMGLFEAIARMNQNLLVASELAATPAFLAAGVQVPDLAVGPGAVLSVGKDETIEPLELGPNLEPLMKVGDWFMDRLAVVTEVGKPTLGITTGEAGGSGIKLRLQFGPFEQKIEAMRPVRVDKYALSAKMVMRLAQYGGLEVPGGPVPRMRVEMGSITPADIASVVDELAKLDGKLSIETVLAVLQTAGYPIDDIETEARRIQMQDTSGALDVTEATGRIDEAERRLGIAPDASQTGDDAAGQ